VLLLFTLLMLIVLTNSFLVPRNFVVVVDVCLFTNSFQVPKNVVVVNVVIVVC
jgi:hypothetical protein